MANRTERTDRGRNNPDIDRRKESDRTLGDRERRERTDRGREPDMPVRREQDRDRDREDVADGS
jgi:hypothetical protein